MALLNRYRECDACGEIYSDNGVDLIHVSMFTEDGPNETWCIHCKDNFLDHQLKHYEEPEVTEATEWSDFDPDC